MIATELTRGSSFSPHELLRFSADRRLQFLNAACLNSAMLN